MIAREILRGGADLIEREGWWPGHKRADPCVGYCALSAIGTVGRNKGSQTVTQVTDAFKEFLGVQWVANWNDSQPDGATVCKALRDCADHLDRQSIQTDSDKE